MRVYWIVNHGYTMPLHSPICAYNLCENIYSDDSGTSERQHGIAKSYCAQYMKESKIEVKSINGILH
jgi:hypothetical protein